MAALGVDGLAMSETLQATSVTSNMPKYQDGFFDDFIDHQVHVDCSSWDHEFAEKTWGPDFKTKTSIGEIRQVKYNRKNGEPKFYIHFTDTSQTYVNLDLDYVLKYSPEVPLKYHLLKADYIVRLSRKATVEAKGSAKGKHKEPEKKDINASEEASEMLVPEKKSTKRGGHERVQLGRDKKRQHAELQAQFEIEA